MNSVRKAKDSISDEAMARATGHPMAHWFALLDDFNVQVNGHASAARFLEEQHKVSPWWSQQITVTFEQERCLRLPGQRADGSFTCTASRTIVAGVEQVFELFSTADGWNRWFTKGAQIDLRVGGRYSNDDKDQGSFARIIEPGPIRSMKERARLEFTWENLEHSSGSKVCIQFIEKSSNKCTIIITHDKLSTSDEMAGMKQRWNRALDSLKSCLETSQPINCET